MITKMRKSILLLVAAGALVVGGFGRDGWWRDRFGVIWVLPGAGHFDHIANHFDHIANWLALFDLPKAEVKRVVRSHGEETLSQIQS
jgi:hypothetical protein